MKGALRTPCLRDSAALRASQVGLEDNVRLLEDERRAARRSSCASRILDRTALSTPLTKSPHRRRLEPASSDLPIARSGSKNPRVRYILLTFVET